MGKATAVANPNIAFIKYWGRVDDSLNLPANPSLSMNLAALTTVTTVEFRPGLAKDVVILADQPASGLPESRVVAHLDRVRAMAGIEERAWVSSRNDFPAGTGLASSASAFAALSLAAARAAGLDLDLQALSRLARLGSGSASRSVPAGYSLWQGERDDSSFAEQVAPPEHWHLHDVVVIVSHQQKAVASYDGHTLAPTSPLYRARLSAVPELLAIVREGIVKRNLAGMGEAIETDALAMHGVMMTSRPSLLYWQPGTVVVLKAVRAMREEGLSVYFTLDAGPNVHCLCEENDAEHVANRLRSLPSVQDVVVSGPGGGVREVEYHLL